MKTDMIGIGHFITLVRDTETGWEFVKRDKATGVVAILADTPEGKILFVEQYRIPVGSRVIELPAGLIGDNNPDETAEEAALKELEEETGWRAGELIELPCGGPSSSGLTNETIRFFYALNLKKVGEGGGVDNENIIVHEVCDEDVPAWLDQKRAEGCLVDPKIYAPIHCLSSYTLAELRKL